ncbi:TonB-dependent receptor [Chondrinema litorale]|uniref:TonB-dependent receptor n=1 Tax=Chondrinema litorale TaxID=2994555 RepID=UPI0025429DD5|nr:TonB-dependent receptor [Chondrinema litorale]UZR98509.1 TonB-dependent receptor [Chondrinema litorale]
MKIFTVSLILFFTSFIAVGQSTNTFIIQGYVTTGESTPLPFAQVIVEELNKGDVADKDGYFEIKNLPSGTFKVTIKALGFKPSSKEVTLKNNNIVNLNINLSEEDTELSEIVVEGKNQSQEIKEMALQVNAIEVKKMANNTADLNQVLNRTTGVKVREQGGVGSDFEFSINGLSGKAVRFFIDGVPLEIMGSSMSLNNIPVNLAERVVVYKGVVPVELGSDALGGAVNIVTNQRITNYLDVAYSYGSFNTHRGSVTGQIRDKKTGMTAKASAFINYSDNNYIMRDVEVIEQIDEDNARFITGDFIRFHDQYFSAMGQVELGVTDKSWADVFFITGSYSVTEKEIQTGTNQDIVYGAARKDGTAYSTTLRYRKDNLFWDGLNLSLFASHSFDKYYITDTTEYKYYWDGNRVKVNDVEIGSYATITHINRPTNFISSNLSYKLNDQHSFGVNYTLNEVENQSYDELITDSDDNPGKLGKHILGFSYQQHFLDDRLTNTYFGKHYNMLLKQPDVITDSETGESETVSESIDYFGYGIATRLRLTTSIGIKASYEKAFRLQNVGEIFGNGYNQIANTELKPESSHNYNAGLFYTNRISQHKLFIEAGAYLRDAKDFISAVVYQSNDQISRYENTANVLVKGLEGELKYNYNELFNLTINVTYQNLINNTKYAYGSDSGTIEATYKNKIPNQPWLFGNSSFGIGKNNLFKDDDRVQFNWNMQYVHWYYLTWENYGAKKGKNIIPNQFIQNASITYSMQGGKYNISVESSNFTNALAYDNFKLQKPGRSYSVKLHYFLK